MWHIVRDGRKKKRERRTCDGLGGRVVKRRWLSIFYHAQATQTQTHTHICVVVALFFLFSRLTADVGQLCNGAVMARRKAKTPVSGRRRR